MKEPEYLYFIFEAFGDEGILYQAGFFTEKDALEHADFFGYQNVKIVRYKLDEE